jgi:hypothetical protein
MKVTVARDGAVLGAWERNDIRAAIADGTLKPDDDYFTTGMTTWLKLSALTNTPSLAPKADLHDGAIAPSHWKQTAAYVGYGLIGVAGASAYFNPSYVTQALVATAGAMVILAGRTFR